MIIVLVKWKIKNENEHIQAFIDFWQSEAVVQDRDGLVGEFLSEVGSNQRYEFITWDLDGSNDKSQKTYINVGIWEDADSFQDQIAQYFNDENPLREFEAERRVRMVLEPKHWRIGAAALPAEDSEDTG